MWQNFLINYFASVAAGITLGIMGLVAYNKIYQNTNQSTKIKQDNKIGDNNVTNIGQQNYYMNATKQTKEAAEEFHTKYDS